MIYQVKRLRERISRIVRLSLVHRNDFDIISIDYIVSYCITNTICSQLRNHGICAVFIQFDGIRTSSKFSFLKNWIVRKSLSRVIYIGIVYKRNCPSLATNFGPIGNFSAKYLSKLRDCQIAIIRVIWRNYDRDFFSANRN